MNVFQMALSILAVVSLAVGAVLLTPNRRGQRRQLPVVFLCIAAIALAGAGISTESAHWWSWAILAWSALVAIWCLTSMLIARRREERRGRDLESQ